MPLVGRIADRIDKFTLYAIASAWMMIVVVIYTNMSVTPLWLVMIVNVLMIGILSRLVPAVALTIAIPDFSNRGAFMSINSLLQQIAGGVAAAAAGMIVQQKTEFSPVEHYNTVDYLMVCISLLSVFLL